MMDVPFGVRVRPPGKQTDGLLPGCEPAGNSGLLVVVSLDDSSLVCLLPWWKEHARFPLLFDPDRVSSPHRPAGIDAHVDLVVPGRGAQDPGAGGDDKSRAEVEQVRPFPPGLGTGGGAGCPVDPWHRPPATGAPAR